MKSGFGDVTILKDPLPSFVPFYHHFWQLLSYPHLQLPGTSFSLTPRELISRTYSEPCQKSKIELFVQIVNGEPLIITVKSTILDGVLNTPLRFLLKKYCLYLPVKTF